MFYSSLLLVFLPCKHVPIYDIYDRHLRKLHNKYALGVDLKEIGWLNAASMAVAW